MQTINIKCDHFIFLYKYVCSFINPQGPDRLIEEEITNKNNQASEWERKSRERWPVNLYTLIKSERSPQWASEGDGPSVGCLPERYDVLILVRNHRRPNTSRLRSTSCRLLDLVFKPYTHKK